MKKWIEPIVKLRACKEALVWAEDYESLKDAWANCERGDWMLWLLGKLAGVSESDSRKKLVLVACQCARLALPYVKKGELRPLKAIETAEAWAGCVDGVTLDMVRDAAYRAKDKAAKDALQKLDEDPPYRIGRFLISQKTREARQVEFEISAGTSIKITNAEDKEG